MDCGHFARHANNQSRHDPYRARALQAWLSADVNAAIRHARRFTNRPATTKITITAMREPTIQPNCRPELPPRLVENPKLSSLRLPSAYAMRQQSGLRK